jgi:hypothetical protein
MAPAPRRLARRCTRAALVAPGALVDRIVDAARR